MFPHPETDRLWISGQANIISQWHPAFPRRTKAKTAYRHRHRMPAPACLRYYRPAADEHHGTAVRCAGDRRPRVRRGLGLAGFTNLDVVSNPCSSKAPYIARLMWHQIIPLSHGDDSPSPRTPFSLFSKLPERRLELRVGKFGLSRFLRPEQLRLRQQFSVHELDCG